MGTSGRTRIDGETVLPFLVSLFAATLVFWTVDIVSPALPVLQNDLALSATMASLVYSTIFVGRLIGNFPAARLVERIGPEKTGAIGGALLAAGSLTIALSPGVATIFPGRVLQGLGTSFIVNAILRSLLRARPNRGAAITVFQFSSTIGTVLGLEVGGILTEALGWRSVFAASVAIGAVILVIAVSTRSVSPPARAQPVEPDVLAVKTPIEWTRALSALGYNMLVFANYGIFVTTALYAEHRFGVSAEVTANLLLVITAMHLAGAFPSGRLIAKIGARPTMGLGIALSCVGMLLAPAAPSPFWIAPPLALYGLGMISSSNAAGDHALDACGRNARGIGLLRLSCDLGLMIGPFSAGALADGFGYASPYFVLPAVSLAPIVFALRPRTRRSSRTQIEPAAP